MKSTITFLLLLFVTNFYSQKKIHLEYDTISKSLRFLNKKDKEIENGIKYSIQIRGINSAVLKPEAKLKNFTFSSDIPEVLKPILLNVSNTGDLNNNQEIIEFFKFVSNNEDSLIKKLTDLKIKEIKTSFKINNFEESFNKIQFNYLPTEELLIIKEKARDQILDSLFNKVTDYYKDLQDLKRLSKKLYEKTINKSDNLKTLKITDSLKILFNNPIDRIHCIIEVSTAINYIKAVTNTFKLRLEKIDNPSLNLTLRYSYLQEYENQLNKHNFISDVNFIYNSLKAKDSVDLESFTAKKSGAELTIHFIDNFKNDTIKTQLFNFYNTKKWVFDFTTGFFYSNKVDQGYYLEKRDSLINNVRREKSRRGDISVGALAHYSYKFTNCFKAGFNLGASLSPFDSKVRYFLGLSSIWGEKSQLAFNGGVSFTKIKELSGLVKQDSFGEFVPSSVAAVPTFERIRAGFYFSLTYNVSNKKKYDN